MRACSIIIHTRADTWGSEIMTVAVPHSYIHAGADAGDILGRIVRVINGQTGGTALATHIHLGDTNL